MSKKQFVQLSVVGILVTATCWISQGDMAFAAGPGFSAPAEVYTGINTTINFDGSDDPYSAYPRLITVDNATEGNCDVTVADTGCTSVKVDSSSVKGTFKLGSTSGIDFSQGDNSGNSFVITIVGESAALNDALKTLMYKPTDIASPQPSQPNIYDTIKLTGVNGSPSGTIAETDIAVKIEGDNDAPDLTAPAGPIPAAAKATYFSAGGDFDVTDPDLDSGESDDVMLLIAYIDSDCENNGGQINLSGTGFTVGSDISTVLAGQGVPGPIVTALLALVPSSVKDATTAAHTADHSAVVGIGALSAAKSALSAVQFDSPVAQTCTLNLFATDLGNNGLPFPALFGPGTEIPHFQFDTATTTFDVSGPSIVVTNVPSPTSVAPPGGSITHAVTVTNTGPADVTINSLVDDQYGNLTTIIGTTCSTGITISTSTPYMCSFSGVVTGVGGETRSDVVTATVQDSNVATATAQGTANVSITGGAMPDIDVSNTVAPTSVTAPGATVVHTVTVTNTSSEDESLTGLTDDIYNPLTAPNTTCDTLISAVLTPSAFLTCTFDAAVTGTAGDTITDTLTATVTDTASHTADNNAAATVTITAALLPDVDVSNTVAPTSVTAPGATVVHTVTVTNTSSEDESLTGLTDDIYNPLTAPNTTCDTLISAVLTPSAFLTCTFDAAVTGSAGDTITDTLTATVTDTASHTADNNAAATVTITAALLPDIDVSNTVAPTSVTAPGATVVHTVTVTNTSSEDESLTGLTDDIYNPLTAPNTTCDTLISAVLTPSAFLTCTFDAAVTGTAGDTITDTLTATVTDTASHTADDNATANVTITAALLPDVDVSNTVAPTSVTAPGATVVHTSRSPTPAARTSP